MADNDESERKVKNSQRILRLGDQYENQPYTESSQKSVMSCLYMEHTF